MLPLPAMLNRATATRSTPAVVAEVRPYDLSMYDGPALDAVAARAASFFSGLESPVRMLALTEPFSAAPALEHIERLLGATPSHANWQRTGLAAYRAFLETLVARADLRRTRYFLVAWPAPALPANALFRAAAACHRSMRQVSPIRKTGITWLRSNAASLTWRSGRPGSCSAPGI